MERDQEDARRRKERRLRDSHFKTKVLLGKRQELTKLTMHRGVEPEFLREFLVMLMSWEILKYSFILSRNKTSLLISVIPPLFNFPSCDLLLCCDFYYII